jgi:hypothetical protein
MTNDSLLPTVTRTDVVLIVDDHFNGIYKAIQDRLGVTDGGVAGMYHSGDGDDLQTTVVDFFMGYLDREYLWGPKKLVGNELIDARFSEIEFLTSAYDVSHWSSCSRVCKFHGWTVADADLEKNTYTVELNLRDTKTVLPLRVEFRPDTAEIVGVDAPRYLDAYSPYLDPDFLLAGRGVEADTALELYGAGFGREAYVSGFRFDSKNTLSADFDLGEGSYDYVMTIEFRPFSTDIVHIRVETMTEAEIMAEQNGALCE